MYPRILVQTTSLLTPHSMQNLAVSTGNLLPHSWQKRERRGAEAGVRVPGRAWCREDSEPLELSSGARHAPLWREEARELVRFSGRETETKKEVKAQRNCKGMNLKVCRSDVQERTPDHRQPNPKINPNFFAAN